MIWEISFPIVLGLQPSGLKKKKKSTNREMVAMGSSVSIMALVPEIAEPAIGSYTRKQAVKCLVQIETLWRQQRCFILSHMCCAVPHLLILISIFLACFFS